MLRKVMLDKRPTNIAISTVLIFYSNDFVAGTVFPPTKNLSTPNVTDRYFASGTFMVIWHGLPGTWGIEARHRGNQGKKKAAANAATSRLNVTYEKPTSFCRELKHGGRTILVAGL